VLKATFCVPPKVASEIGKKFLTLLLSKTFDMQCFYFSGEVVIVKSLSYILLLMVPKHV
jgi:hypothetical protein